MIGVCSSDFDNDVRTKAKWTPVCTSIGTDLRLHAEVAGPRDYIEGVVVELLREWL